MHATRRLVLSAGPETVHAESAVILYVWCILNLNTGEATHVSSRYSLCPYGLIAPGPIELPGIQMQVATVQHV